MFIKTFIIENIIKYFNSNAGKNYLANREILNIKENIKLIESFNRKNNFILSSKSFTDSFELISYKTKYSYSYKVKYNDYHINDKGKIIYIPNREYEFNYDYMINDIDIVSGKLPNQKYNLISFLLS